MSRKTNRLRARLRINDEQHMRVRRSQASVHRQLEAAIEYADKRITGLTMDLANANRLIRKLETEMSK